MGEGSGREPGRQPAGPDVPAQASGEKPDRVECMAGRSVHRLRQTNPASRVQGSNDLGRVRGGTGEPDAASRPFDGFVEKAVRASTTLGYAAGSTGFLATAATVQST